MIQLLIVLIFIGVGLYLVNKIVPMEPWVKTVINVVVFLCVFLWLLQIFGVTNFNTSIPKFR